MVGALLGSIIGRESRACACGVCVEHLVIRYAVRRVVGGIAQAKVYQPRAHRAPCGRQCGRGLPPGEAPAVERHHLEGCQLCVVAKASTPSVCPTCGLWREGSHSCPEAYVCRECGDETRAQVEPLTRAQMEAERLCFLCHFWREKLAVRNLSTVIRVDGCHYILGDENPRIPTSARGHGGRVAIIVFQDGRRVTSSNVWYQGRIPEHFRGRLPDNARLEWADEREVANA